MRRGAAAVLDLEVTTGHAPLQQVGEGLLHALRPGFPEHCRHRTGGDLRRAQDAMPGDRLQNGVEVAGNLERHPAVRRMQIAPPAERPQLGG